MFCFFFITEFIGVILVHQTIQVSSVQFSKTSSAHCIVCPLPKASLLPFPLVSPCSTSTYSHPLFPLTITTLLSVSMCYIYTVFLKIPLPSFIQLPSHPLIWQLSVYSTYPCLFLFCSLDSTYKWDHMVLVFLWLAYFTYHDNLQVIHAVAKGKISFFFMAE